MGRDTKRNREDRERTRAALLRAALQLFAEHGVARVSVAQVAKAAGVSKGLVYHYFSSRDELLQAVIDERIRAVAELAAGIPDDASDHERLRHLASRTVEAVRQDPAAYRLLLSVLADPEGNEQVRALVTARPQEFEARASAFRALFAGAADPAVEARFFQAAVLGIAVLQAVSPLAGPPEPLVARLMQAIGAPGGSDDTR